MDLTVGTAGHIDHGKTALVKALTGVDTDRLPAEKARGITIDLGFAALKLGGRTVGLIDVPGHERFIRNMLAGSTGIDLALLVIAADDSVMPQTREHLEILRLLRVRAGVIALTKCDLAAPDWLDLVEDEARALVAGTFLATAPIVRTSATTGLGLDRLREALDEACEGLPPRTDLGLFRMPIDRAFSVRGHGTVVSGTIASGRVGPGDEVEWWPSGRPVRVRGVHRHDRPEDQVGRGSRAAANLAGVHHADVTRGDEIGSPGYLTPSRILSVEVRATPGVVRPPRHRGRYRVHLGTAEVSARLALLGDGQSASERDPILGQLVLAEAVVAVYGEPFVLREESPPTTVGGGLILEPVARRVRRRDRAAIARLGRLASDDPLDRIEAVLVASGLDPWTERSLCRDAGVPIDAVTNLVGRLEDSGRMVAIATGPRRSGWVHAEVVTLMEGRLLRALTRLHAASPRHSAIRRPRVVAALAYLGNDAIVDGLIDRLGTADRVVADDRTVAIVGHTPKLSQAERKLKAELAEAFRAGGMTPPDLADWTKGATRATALSELVSLLCEEERLVAIGPGVYLDQDVAAELRRKVETRLGDGSGITMADLRDLLGTTRKYAVPIGEYLDRIGLTRRDGDVRRLATPAPEPGASR